MIVLIVVGKDAVDGVVVVVVVVVAAEEVSTN
jgi:hypothetical protein